MVEPGTPPLVSVLAEYQGEVVFEVVKNTPGDSPYVKTDTNPTGIVTVTGPDGFLYKIRPESETSVAFGRLGGDDEIEVRISDRRTQVVRLKSDGTSQVVLTSENNEFHGEMTGISIMTNGSIGIGAQIPTAVRNAFGS